MCNKYHLGAYVAIQGEIGLVVQYHCRVAIRRENRLYHLIQPLSLRHCLQLRDQWTSGRDCRFLTCMSMFSRYFVTVLQTAPTSLPSARSDFSSRSSSSASFEASCRSGSFAVRNRAFFRCSDRCPIVSRCCRCQNSIPGVHKVPHDVRF